MADHDGAPHPASDLADSEFEPALLAVLVSPVARAAADAQTPTSPSAALLSPQLSNANAESPDEILMAQDNPLTSDLDEPNAAELSEVDPVQADAGGFSTDLTERSARELLQPGNGF